MPAAARCSRSGRAPGTRPSGSRSRTCRRGAASTCSRPRRAPTRARSHPPSSPAGCTGACRDRTSGESFYREEIAPNWDDLARGERAAKIEAFARFVNVIARADDNDAAAGMGPVVRTKVVVLAWAFDSLYRDDYLERIVSEPDRFGEIEVSA